MKHFMLDIETTGLDPSAHDILEIGLLECTRTEDGTYEPGRAYSRILHTSQKPTDEWIKVNHKDLLRESMKCPIIEIAKVRAEILAFFKECGEAWRPSIMGLNVHSLDLPFLFQKNILQKSDIHYRTYELRGSFYFAGDVLGEDDATLFKLANDLAPEIVPVGKPHRALYDCYNQLKTLNGMIRLTRLGF